VVTLSKLFEWHSDYQFSVLIQRKKKAKKKQLLPREKLRLSLQQHKERVTLEPIQCLEECPPEKT
jgi:hypothetical protein